MGLAVLALALLAGCGGSSGGQGAHLNFWAYNEPGGTFAGAAKRCTQQSGGRYTIEFHALGNDPDTQRQQLVRRLAAKDSSIDIMSMDVIWTAEFAEAGWIKPWPQAAADKVKQGTLKGPLDTATYQGKLYAAPANSNTQLLWYRKDLVKGDAPKTWDDLIDHRGEDAQGGPHRDPGRPVRGHHGVVQLADPVGGRPDPRRSRQGQPRAAADARRRSA